MSDYIIHVVIRYYESYQTFLSHVKWNPKQRVNITET